MASLSLLSPVFSSSVASIPSLSFHSHGRSSLSLRRSDRVPLPSSTFCKMVGNRSTCLIVCAIGDVSAEGTNYLVIGAIAVALLATAFPVLFSRKDLCPECDGAGFIRKSGAVLAANAARKDQKQIVCPRCNGLGKLGQVDK
eukprot:c18821_g1_i1 orf=286-711(+)